MSLSSSRDFSKSGRLEAKFAPTNIIDGELALPLDYSQVNIHVGSTKWKEYRCYPQVDPSPALQAVFPRSESPPLFNHVSARATEPAHRQRLLSAARQQLAPLPASRAPSSVSPSRARRKSVPMFMDSKYVSRTPLDRSFAQGSGDDSDEDEEHKEPDGVGLPHTSPLVERRPWQDPTYHNYGPDAAAQRKKVYQYLVGTHVRRPTFMRQLCSIPDTHLKSNSRQAPRANRLFARSGPLPRSNSTSAFDEQIPSGVAALASASQRLQQQSSSAEQTNTTAFSSTQPLPLQNFPSSSPEPLRVSAFPPSPTAGTATANWARSPLTTSDRDIVAATSPRAQKLQAEQQQQQQEMNNNPTSLQQGSQQQSQKQEEQVASQTQTQLSLQDTALLLPQPSQEQKTQSSEEHGTGSPGDTTTAPSEKIELFKNGPSNRLMAGKTKPSSTTKPTMKTPQQRASGTSPHFSAALGGSHHHSLVPLALQHPHQQQPPLFSTSGLSGKTLRRPATRGGDVSSGPSAKSSHSWQQQQDTAFVVTSASSPTAAAAAAAAAASALTSSVTPQPDSLQQATNASGSPTQTLAPSHNTVSPSATASEPPSPLTSLPHVNAALTNPEELGTGWETSTNAPSAMASRIRLQTAPKTGRSRSAKSRKSTDASSAELPDVRSMSADGPAGSTSATGGGNTTTVNTMTINSRARSPGASLPAAPTSPSRGFVGSVKKNKSVSQTYFNSSRGDIMSKLSFAPEEALVTHNFWPLQTVLTFNSVAPSLSASSQISAPAPKSG